MQYNKMDPPDALPGSALDRHLNTGEAPSFEGAALQGTGVFETLREICQRTPRTPKEREAAHLSSEGVPARHKK